MKYKVVPFAAAIANNEDSSKLAAQLESIINSHAAAGWQYVGVHQLQAYQAGSAGCFGIGATQGAVVTSSFVVFLQ